MMLPEFEKSLRPEVRPNTSRQVFYANVIWKSVAAFPLAFIALIAGIF